MAIIMDGKATSAKLRKEFLEKVTLLKEKGVTPGLAVIIVGEDPASKTYVNNKEKACVECGYYSEKYALPEETSEAELLGLIEQLNGRDEINGILVQLPLPKHICEEHVIRAIHPLKDVDAFHPENVGHIMTGDFAFVPCTPAGVMELLKEYGIDPSGKRAVIIGRSNIVGKPAAMLLLHENATVTVCHSRTKDLAAIGKLEFVTRDMVKPGAVVIDVGINRNAEGKLRGDVKFDEVEEIASYITPVPGGVGPMTITMLMQNTLRAACIQNQISL